MMCELPSNAMLADEFLEHFDGFSIGSNDMTQLTLGLDRDSGLVAGALRRARRRGEGDARAWRSAPAARHGKYVGICGQGPSDHPDLAQWLMEQGIESLSLNPDTVVSTWHGARRSPSPRRRNQRLRSSRCFSRFHSFSFSSARLSCLSLPFASADLELDAPLV